MGGLNLVFVLIICAAPKAVVCRAIGTGACYFGCAGTGGDGLTRTNVDGRKREAMTTR